MTSKFFPIDANVNIHSLQFAAELLNAQVGALPTTTAYLKENYTKDVFCSLVDASQKPFGFARLRHHLPFLADDAKHILILLCSGQEHSFTPEVFAAILTYFNVTAHKNMIVEVRSEHASNVAMKQGFKIGTKKFTMLRKLVGNTEDLLQSPSSISFKVERIQRPDEMLLVTLHQCELGFIRDVPFALPIVQDSSFTDFKKTFANEKNIFFVAYNASQHLMGYSCLTINHTVKIANFSTTGVLPAYRGKGVARAIKMAALKWCLKEGFTTVTSQNHANNPKIIALNQQLGFNVAQKRFEMIPS